MTDSPHSYLARRLVAHQGLTPSEAEASLLAVESGTATGEQFAAVHAELVATFAAIRTAVQAAVSQLGEQFQRTATALQKLAAATQDDFALAPPRTQEDQ